MIVDVNVLENIHHTVSKKFKYQTDEKRYHLVEKWVMPDGNYDGSQRIVGDCEDFALGCRKLCRDAGITQTRLVICYTEQQEGHCVLEASGWILDNRQKHVLTRNYLEQEGYSWLAISGFHSGDDWHRIEV